jgi:5-methylcytosine-specific restriction endonuclease McrA
MKRDGYRCQLCGNSQEGGAKLHIDHRTPLAKGGSNEDDNLWTLCEDCNLGKSDRDL